VWYDSKLTWDPDAYHGVSTLYIPSEDIWLPDIVLYKQVTLMTKAGLQSTGKVLWEPPAIYKSSCQIDVEFFPFDSQNCTMKFGSWTYDGLQVDLRHIQQANSSEPLSSALIWKTFYESTEWDVLEVPAKRHTRRSTPAVRSPTRHHLRHHTSPKDPVLHRESNHTLRGNQLSHRHGFYLPSDSGEKITLCISILLASDHYTANFASSAAELASTCCFTMILVTLSIIVTVIVLNVHFAARPRIGWRPGFDACFLSRCRPCCSCRRIRAGQGCGRCGETGGGLESGVTRWRKAPQAAAAQCQQQSRQNVRIARDLEVLLTRTQDTWNDRDGAAAAANFNDELADPRLRRDLQFALYGVEFIARHFETGRRKEKCEFLFQFCLLKVESLSF
uniref:Neur_chan_LBD domain-containing protein n=1 Tax=Macrostomum lignano TaxID=282301 RepID=A0A1I8FQE3_9PLAT